MTICVKDDYEKVHLYISGDINSDLLQVLNVRLLDKIQYGYRRIIINIHGVQNLDHSGMETLQTICGRLSAMGGELIIESGNTGLRPV